MLKGVNIDITNHPPDLGWLARMSQIDAVRFPSRWNTDEYIYELRKMGLFTLCVVDTTSAGFIAGNGECSAYQIHNEVDSTGVASGALEPEVYREELRIYRESYPELTLVASGLSAGDYTAAYLKSVAQTLRDYRYAGWAIHPYGKTPSAAASLFTAHQKVMPDLPGLYTECHPDPASVRQFYKSARDAGCTGVFYHCWNDDMTLGSEGIRLGLVDEHRRHKRELGLWLLS